MSFRVHTRSSVTKPKLIRGVLWNWNCSLSYSSQYKSMLSTSIMVVSYDVSLFVWSFLVKNGCATLRSQIIVMGPLGNIVQYSSVYIYGCYESNLNYWWRGKRNAHKSVHEASKAVSLEWGLSSLNNQKCCTVSAQNREMLHRTVYAQNREMRYRRRSKQRNTVLSVLRKREMLDWLCSKQNKNMYRRPSNKTKWCTVCSKQGAVVLSSLETEKCKNCLRWKQTNAVLSSLKPEKCCFVSVQNRKCF